MLCGCAGTPPQTLRHFDLGPTLSPDGRFISFARTSWLKGRPQPSYLKVSDLYNGTETTIAGPMDDLIWHPLDRALYYLSGDALLEVNPERLTRQQIFALRRPPYGDLTLWGWEDGQVLILKQHIPEITPSGSYCYRFDVANRQLLSRYYLPEPQWAAIPSGNEHKRTESLNKKLRLRKDGRRLGSRLLKPPLPAPRDYYSLEIDYGTMWLELPLAVYGDFVGYRHFWDYRKDSVFFSSRNYFWRCDLSDLTMVKLGLTEKIHTGLLRPWNRSTLQSPALYRVPLTPPSEDLQVMPPPDINGDTQITVRAFFVNDALNVSTNEQLISINVPVEPSWQKIARPFSMITFAQKSPDLIFSHGGRIGIYKRNSGLEYLTDGPYIPVSANLTL
jgi:hypothetical protein